MDNADGSSFLSIGAGIPKGFDLTGQVIILKKVKTFEETFSSVSKGRYLGKDVSRFPFRSIADHT